METGTMGKAGSDGSAWDGPRRSLRQRPGLVDSRQQTERCRDDGGGSSAACRHEQAVTVR